MGDSTASTATFPPQTVRRRPSCGACYGGPVGSKASSAAAASLSSPGTPTTSRELSRPMLQVSPPGKCGTALQGQQVN
ncbi:hypothetical protein ON010_g18987 [Phytophthora cinnamomi]|nr:hypothetical protein ON010_g18987 [Phytophthora cinnamomi]